MKRKLSLLLSLLIIGLLAACGNEDNNEEKGQETQELVPLDVEFIVPEQANVGEKVQLKAVVTYGEEKVEDADEVMFEYWEAGNEEESTKVEANNNGDGIYTAEVTFDHDGVFEMYAHTTARSMHTMPKKSITIGEGASATEEEHPEHANEHGHSGHDEGFHLHFGKPEDVKVNQDTQLTVHLQLDNEPLTNANVRYEIFQENAEKHDWVDADESATGAYTSSHAFKESGTYTVIIHVENDDGLHEHEEYKIEVSK